MGALNLENLEPAAYFVPISMLRPWIDNPRDNDHAVPEVADSIKRFGFATVITGRFDGEKVEVLAGHTRLKAALKLGLTKVPVLLSGLDPVDGHLFALADNKKGELANWSDGLAEVLADFDDDVDITGLGWTDEELEAVTDTSLPDGGDWGEGFGGLPDEDRQPFQAMTFSLHDDQAAEVKRALEVAKGMGEFGDQNPNSNGNAIARIVETFLTERGHG